MLYESNVSQPQVNLALNLVTVVLNQASNVMAVTLELK